jgi:hypothetical protein
MNKTHTFNADELIQAVEDTRDRIRGARKGAMRKSKIVIPPPGETIAPGQIAKLRTTQKSK